MDFSFGVAPIVSLVLFQRTSPDSHGEGSRKISEMERDILLNILETSP